MKGKCRLQIGREEPPRLLLVVRVGCLGLHESHGWIVFLHDDPLVAVPFSNYYEQDSQIHRQFGDVCTTVLKLVCVECTVD